MSRRAIGKLAMRFDRLTLRERLLVTVSIVSALVMLWTVLVFDPLAAKERMVSAEMSGLHESMSSLAATIESDLQENPVRIALAREKTLDAELAVVNEKLASQAAGLIPPERMVQVIHDVLSRQRGVSLVTLHNKPVTTLAPQTSDAPAETGAGPFVHPVELIVEGRYLDVLAYLQALEALPWRFYWTRLELTSEVWPVNRVRIELSTLSMERHWIGV